MEMAIEVVWILVLVVAVLIALCLVLGALVFVVIYGYLGLMIVVGWLYGLLAGVAGGTRNPDGRGQGGA